MRLKLAVLIAACATAWTQAAEAQFTQFTPPGTFVGRTLSRSETVERAMQNARWKLGRGYFEPWAALRQLTYVDTSDRDDSQLTATVGVGVRGYAPVGAETTLAFHLLPEYVWWQDESDRNRWNGRYGVGLFGDLGRTGIELSATRQDDAAFFSQELEEKVNTRLDEAEAVFEIDVSGGFSLVLGGTFRAIRFLDDPAEFVDLSVVDRDEQFYRLLVEIPLPRGFRLGVGAEHSQTDFEAGTSDRSNSGTSPLLSADYQSPSLFFKAELLYLGLTPDGPDSRFVDYSGLAGSAELAWRTWNRLEPQIYARNNLVYSFTDEWAYFESPTGGLALRMAVTRGLWVRVFGEAGSNDYTPFGPLGLERQDDFTSYGVDVGFGVGKASLSFGAWATDYDSSLPAFDRKTSSFRANLGISTGGGPWG